MKVIADICVVPMGVGTSVSKQVARCQEILDKFDIKTKLHAYGTNLEGHVDEVMAAIKKIHEVLHDEGVPRISTSIKLGSRIDKAQTMEDKVKSVHAHREAA